MDVSSPSSPLRVGSFDLTSGQQVNDVQVLGNLAYLAAGFLEIVDVGTPAQPRPVATCAAVNSARAVQVVGQLAYVAGQSATNGVEGLVVIDVSDPAQPQLVGFCQTAAPHKTSTSSAHWPMWSLPTRPEHSGTLIHPVTFRSSTSPTRPSPPCWGNARSAKKGMRWRWLAATPMWPVGPGVRMPPGGATV